MKTVGEIIVAKFCEKGEIRVAKFGDRPRKKGLARSIECHMNRMNDNLIKKFNLINEGKNGFIGSFQEIKRRSVQ
jgi:hypothetical protein